MARLLSIDYGKKRCGIAVSDPLQIIANGLVTVETHNLIHFLKKYFIDENVEKVIIGMPKNLNNTDTDATQAVRLFIGKFKKIFPNIPIIEVDERYTSKMATQTIIEAGIKKKERRNKSLIDEVSATIMLKDYMLYKDNM